MRGGLLLLLSLRWNSRGKSMNNVKLTEVDSISASIERYYSRGPHLCKFIATKKATLKEFKTPTGFVWNTNIVRCFIVLEHQYGRRDVM